MALYLDDRIDRKRRRQFAAELQNLPEPLQQHLLEYIGGEYSAEFYAGLLSGFTVATTLLQAGKADMIPPATAAVAHFCEQQEFDP